MRRRGRTDTNQKEIVKTFRQLGFSVAVTSMVGSGFPDIVIGKYKKNWLVEIKDGEKFSSKRELTEDEKKFMAEWRGSIYIVETIEQAIVLAKILDGKQSWDRNV